MRMWLAGEQQAGPVYRARVGVPLVAIGLCVAVAGWLTQSSQVLIYGAAGAIAILVRRRRAVIFTPDAVVFRPIFGEPLRVPFHSVQSAGASGFGAYQEAAPSIRIDLVHGGSIDVQLCGIPRCDEIARRIREAS